MSRLVLTGAGASHDVQNACPRAPPVGSQLIDELLRRDFPAWLGLSDELKEGFKGSEGFEGGFVRVREKDDTLTAGLLREMARYFLDFRPSGRTKYDFLVDRLSRSATPTFWATLNYDLLLDFAIASRFGRVTYSNARLPHTILKVHGAPNIWPDAQGASFVNIVFQGFGENVAAPEKELTREDAIRECATAAISGFAPAMALFAPKKDLLFCAGFIRAAQAEYGKSVATCEEVWVVGVGYAGHDTHVWEPLERADGKLTIVDPCSAQFAEFQACRSRAGRGTRLIEGKFGDFLSEICMRSLE